MNKLLSILILFFAISLQAKQTSKVVFTYQWLEDGKVKVESAEIEQTSDLSGFNISPDWSDAEVQVQWSTVKGKVKVDLVVKEYGKDKVLKRRLATFLLDRRDW